MSVTAPSPGLGWRGEKRLPLLRSASRASGTRVLYLAHPRGRPVAA